MAGEEFDLKQQEAYKYNGEDGLITEQVVDPADLRTIFKEDLNDEVNSKDLFALVQAADSPPPVLQDERLRAHGSYGGTCTPSAPAPERAICSAVCAKGCAPPKKSASDGRARTKGRMRRSLGIASERKWP